MTATRFADTYGPYALIAGGSDGLGAAFAEAVAQRGLNLVLVARDPDRLDATATRIRDASGVDVITIVGDLADSAPVTKRIGELDASIGLLVYNAAYAPIGLFENVTADQLVQAADVNVRGPLQLTKLLSAPMIERGRGGIILMSSLAGSQGSPNLAVYAATKSFTTTLAEGLWKELRPHGVDVLACVAGAILTPGYRQAESAKPAPGSLESRIVAERTLDALGSGPLFVPGAINKIARVLLTRVLSRRAAIAIMSRNTGGLS